MESQAGESKTEHKMTPFQWGRITLIYLVIPLVLMGCAGDFAWWQAWAYSAIIIAAGVGGRI